MGESRARLGAALVSVAMTLFHVAPASAEVLTTTEWRDNPIRGTTPSELLAYMRGHMIADEDGPAFANITHDHKLTVTTRPAGNSCRVQNLSFSFAFVITLPKALDEKVARLHLAKIGAHLTELNDKQSAYIGVGAEGPFKPDHYRY